MAIPVYKYFLKPNSLIEGKCPEKDGVVGSKINLSFVNRQDGLLETHLRIKACLQNYGLKKFSFDFVVPEVLLDERALLNVPFNSTQKIGTIELTRENDSHGLAVYSLSPASLGFGDNGVQSIRFFVALEESARQQVFVKTLGQFAWAGISITYKKGALMPVVNLRGDLTMVEEE